MRTNKPKIGAVLTVKEVFSQKKIKPPKSPLKNRKSPLRPALQSSSLHTKRSTLTTRSWENAIYVEEAVFSTLLRPEAENPASHSRTLFSGAPDYHHSESLHM